MLKSWETERLIVRPLVRDDLNALFPLIYGDPEVVRYFASYTTYAEAAPLHERKVAFNEDPGSGGFGYFGVVLKDTPSLIGQVLLGPPEPVTWIVLPETSPAYPLGDEVEVGYALGQAYWGQGFAAEACRVVIAYVFEDLGLSRLVNSVDSRNPRSIRLMERLGSEVEPNLHPDGKSSGCADGEELPAGMGITQSNTSSNRRPVLTWGVGCFACQGAALCDGE